MRRPATNLSVKGRQGEAVRGKRVLSPTSDLNAARRPPVNDPVTKAWERLLPSVRRGISRHGQSAGLGRIDYSGGRWAQPWARASDGSPHWSVSASHSVGAPGGITAVPTRAGASDQTRPKVFTAIRHPTGARMLSTSRRPRQAMRILQRQRAKSRL